MYKKKKTQKVFQSTHPINKISKLYCIPLKYLLPFRKFLNKQK